MTCILFSSYNKNREYYFYVTDISSRSAVEEFIIDGQYHDNTRLQESIVLILIFLFESIGH